MASLLARSRGCRAVLVRALVRAMVLCSWARHLTLTVPLSIQVFKWVPTNLMRGGGNLQTDKHPIQWGVSSYRNWNNLRPDGPLRLACSAYLYLALLNLRKL